MDAHLRPDRSLTRAGISDLMQQRGRAELLDQRRVEGDLVQAVVDLARRLRRARPLDRVDLHQDRVRRRALPDQRRHGRVARVTAVPVRFAVDLHGLEHRGQARRGEQYVGCEVGIPEHAAAARAHVGRGDEELDRRRGEPVETDAVRQDLGERVRAEGVGVVRREHPRRDVEDREHRRIVERPAAGQDLDRAAAQGAEQRRVRHALPELLERDPRLRGPAFGQPVGHHYRVHRAGGGAGDAVEHQPAFLEQPVEDAPGECAVGAAALQSEVDRYRGAVHHYLRTVKAA